MKFFISKFLKTFGMKKKRHISATTNAPESTVCWEFQTLENFKLKFSKKRF